MRRALAMVALAGMLTACGSTVQQTGAPATGLAGDLLAPADLSVPAGGAVEGPASIGLDAPAAVGAGAGGSARPGGSPGAKGSAADPSAPAPDGGQGSPSVGAPAAVRGLTATTITLGTLYLNTEAVTTFQQQAGAQGAAVGDSRGQQRALADYLNARGGIAGRQIELVQREFNIAGDVASESQAACTHWTEDNAVYAGLGIIAGADYGFAPCMAAHKTIALSFGDLAASSQYEKYADYLYSPSTVDLVVVARTVVDGLHPSGFFGQSPKVGSLYLDSTDFREAVTQGLKPALARHGLELDAEVAVQYDGLSDYGRLVAAIQAAVLRFKSEGITHVLPLDTSAAFAHFFMQQAEQQQYYPKYGLTPGSQPAFLALNESKAQLRNAVAVGWQPQFDVNTPPVNAAGQLCESIMTEAGHAPKSPSDRSLQFAFCDQVFLVKAAMERATSFSPQGFRAAVESLGSVPSVGATSLGDRFASGKHWGAAVYRTVAFVESCGCFQYSSGDQPIPQ